jgi:hypothetical protein
MQVKDRGLKDNVLYGFIALSKEDKQEVADRYNALFAGRPDGGKLTHEEFR